MRMLNFKCKKAWLRLSWLNMLAKLFQDLSQALGVQADILQNVGDPCSYCFEISDFVIYLINFVINAELIRFNDSLLKGVKRRFAAVYIITYVCSNISVEGQNFLNLCV